MLFYDDIQITLCYGVDINTPLKDDEKVIKTNWFLYFTS